jgi:hypothetical protein
MALQSLRGYFQKKMSQLRKNAGLTMASELTLTLQF